MVGGKPPTYDIGLPSPPFSLTLVLLSLTAAQPDAKTSSHAARHCRCTGPAVSCQPERTGAGPASHIVQDRLVFNCTCVRVASCPLVLTATSGLHMCKLCLGLLRGLLLGTQQNADPHLPMGANSSRPSNDPRMNCQPNKTNS